MVTHGTPQPGRVGTAHHWNYGRGLLISDVVSLLGPVPYRKSVSKDAGVGLGRSVAMQ